MYNDHTLGTITPRLADDRYGMADRAADRILGGIDLPGKRQKVGHQLLVEGWALAPGGEPLRIDLAVDGTPVEWGRCGFPRYDIWQKYNSEQAYTSGFMARLPASGFDKGPHQLQVTASIDSGPSHTLGTRTFIKTAARLSVPPLGGVGGQMRKGDHGWMYADLFKKLAGLAPHHDVLDIGCGMGCMALPLTRFLAGGTYHGLDNTKLVIDCCSKHITPRFPAFEFTHADIYNKMYNPHGRVIASRYRFPFSDESFDFICLVSVFTHLLTDDFDHYLSEIARVLRNGGNCLATFFLLNAESQRAINQGLTRRTFRFQLRDCRTDCEATPEGAIAYEEELVRRFFAKHRLKIQEPIHFGNWTRRQEGLDNQDIIVAKRDVRES